MNKNHTHTDACSLPHEGVTASSLFFCLFDCSFLSFLSGFLILISYLFVWFYVLQAAYVCSCIFSTHLFSTHCLADSMLDTKAKSTNKADISLLLEDAFCCQEIEKIKVSKQTYQTMKNKSERELPTTFPMHFSLHS